MPMSPIGQRRLAGTRYIFRQQLYTIFENFEVFDATGSTVISAHGNGRLGMEDIELLDGSGTPVLEVKHCPGVPSRVDVTKDGTRLLSIGERRIGLRDHCVIDTPMPATFDIVGDVQSTSYTITIDGQPVAEVVMKAGLAEDDTYSVTIVEGREFRILLALILAIDILTHQDKH